MAVAPLPNGEKTFADTNGNPLAGGSVGYYLPGGLTAKPTWQDSAQTILNDNPITLDQAGRAIVWGGGLYREIVKDANGNQIWDQNTLGAGDITTTSLILEGMYEGSLVPGNLQFLDGHNLPSNVQWGANFPGSLFHVESGFLPTATYVITINLNDSQIGTLTVNTDGTYAYATTGVTRTANKGDRITLIGASVADITINQFFWTLNLTVTS